MATLKIFFIYDNIKDELKCQVSTYINIPHLRKLKKIVVMDFRIDIELLNIIYRKQIVCIDVNTCPFYIHLTDE